MSLTTKQKVQKLDEHLTALLDQFPPIGVSQTASWPSLDELTVFHFDVCELVKPQRKNPYYPAWRAYKLVNKRWPSIRLISRVDKLVNRARERLQEVPVSGLERLRREDHEGMPEAMRFWTDFEAFGGAWNADRIEWEHHEKVLFSRSDNELVRPQSGDPPGLRRLKCYARALEFIVEDEFYYQPLRDEALPLLKWIGVYAQNPDYYDFLKWDYHSEWLSGFAKESLDDLAHSEKRHREKAQQRIRQGIHRLRSILTSRERMVLAKGWYHKKPSQFRAKVSEADFVRKISR
jgi:hypothetical protein